MSGSTTFSSASSVYRDVTAIASGLVNGADQIMIHALGYDLIAPIWLRYRVQGTPDLRTYLEAGRLSRQSMETVLHGVSKRLTDFPRILDFGCGCGRTLRWMRDLAPASRLHGADVDGEAIAWCRDHIDFATFAATNSQPRLPYADDSFDFIYALSVFTHLPLTAQFAWLEELRRVLAPGGIVFLTVLGYRRDAYAARHLPPPPRIMGQRVMASGSLDIWSFLDLAEIAQLESEGFAFIPYRNSTPDNEYGVAYHRQDFITERFSSILTVKDYVPEGLCGYLDAVLLEK